MGHRGQVCLLKSVLKSEGRKKLWEGGTRQKALSTGGDILQSPLESRGKWTQHPKSVALPLLCR